METRTKTKTKNIAILRVICKLFQRELYRVHLATCMIKIAFTISGSNNIICVM